MIRAKIRFLSKAMCAEEIQKAMRESCREIGERLLHGDRPRLVYVGGPIGKSSPLNIERMRIASAYAASLLRQGIPVFSPAAMGLGMIMAESSEGRTMPRGFGFWRDTDFAILRACSELHVLMLPGWRKSVGVRAEIAEAKRLGIKVVYVPKGGL